MPAQTRTRGEFHETEGLSCSRIKNLVNINAHSVKHYFEFIHQSDVHRTEDVFGELHRLSRLAITHRHSLCYRRIIQSKCKLKGILAMTAYHLRDSSRIEIWVARILPLGTIRHIKIYARLQTRCFLE